MNHCIWQSDWNGDEVGYPEYNVVGLYFNTKEDTYQYIDTETGYVLEQWKEEE